MVFYPIVDAHKRDNKMSSVLLHSAVPGRKKSILKKPWGGRKVRKHGAGENQLCLGDTCKTKKLCALQSSWMRQQPALVPSKCPSAGANTQERCPAALCHYKTPSWDEVRSWKVLTHSSNTTNDGNWSWKILQQLHLEEERQIPASLYNTPRHCPA